MERLFGRGVLLYALFILIVMMFVGVAAVGAEDVDSGSVMATEELQDDLAAMKSELGVEELESENNEAVATAEGGVAEQADGLDSGEEAEVGIADPFEPVNRAVFSFNDNLFEYVLVPAANGYRYITPEPVRTGIGNFFSNIVTPVSMVNNLLQGNPKGFSSEFVRLFLNTTFGLGGFFDVASAMGIPRDEADFGQTLGMYGLPAGYPVVLPFFGNYNFRDTVGLAGDMAMSPPSYLGLYVYGLPGSASYNSVRIVDEASQHQKDYRDFKNAAIDFYTGSIEAKSEYRLKQIKKAKGRSLFFN